MTTPSPVRDQRVLLLALTAKDGGTTRTLLRNVGIGVEICADFDALMHELPRGCAAVAIAEEHLSESANARLAVLLQAQPAWSDLPILILARQGANSEAAAEAMRVLGNVTLLERPLRLTTLVSAVRTAVRARDRQYQIRSHIEDRERAAEALRLADQRKDEFLATLGHELRNPLTPLMTGLHLMRLAEAQYPNLGQLTAIMERQVTYLVRLVDDLLEVSRITRGVIDMHRQVVDVAALLRAALDTTQPMFEAARHNLIVDLPDTPITVMGDAVRLTQVFTNLLTNAAKYTNAGGRIALTARCDGDNAVITVRDNGIGIAPSHLDSVFEMFMQVDRSSRRSQGGLGIGLTLVRSLVTMHGGSVEARSQGIGTGSEFTVTLPALAADAAAASGAHELRAFPPRRVLIVDDNRDAADTLGELLRALGATVAVQYGGQAALQIVDEFAPDVVLLDIGMPGMDGYEVARRLRAEAHNGYCVGGDEDGSRSPREIPLLIALTGWGQDQDFRRSQLAGFDHHLVKPPDVERLRQLLSNH